MSIRTLGVAQLSRTPPIVTLQDPLQNLIQVGTLLITFRPACIGFEGLGFAKSSTRNFGGLWVVGILKRAEEGACLFAHAAARYWLRRDVVVRFLDDFRGGSWGLPKHMVDGFAALSLALCHAPRRQVSEGQDLK